MAIISGPGGMPADDPPADGPHADGPSAADPSPRPLVGSTGPDDPAPTPGADMGGANTGGANTGGAASGDVIRDVTTDSFMADVIETSMHTPVVVDFWAPWCGPCKQLGPMLEKYVKQAGGAVRMARINVDENQELAAQMRVQSIPVVYVFSQGQPVDGFQGAVPESKIKEMISRLMGGAKAPIDEALDAANAALDSGDPEQASEIFAQVLGDDDGNATALAGLIRCAAAAGDTEQGHDIFNGMTPERQRHADVAAAMAALDLAEQAGGGNEDTAALKAAVEQNPADHQSRFDLALALYGNGRNEEAIDELIEIIRRDRAWNDGAAREQVLKIFEALGHAHPATIDGRKRLSTVLFS